MQKFIEISEPELESLRKAGAAIEAILGEMLPKLGEPGSPTRAACSDCSGSCEGGCQGTCSGNCNGGCKGSCKMYCNTSVHI